MRTRPLLAEAAFGAPRRRPTDRIIQRPAPGRPLPSGLNYPQTRQDEPAAVSLHRRRSPPRPDEQRLSAVTCRRRATHTPPRRRGGPVVQAPAGDDRRRDACARAEIPHISRAPSGPPSPLPPGGSPHIILHHHRERDG